MSYFVWHERANLEPSRFELGIRRAFKRLSPLIYRAGSGRPIVSMLLLDRVLTCKRTIFANVVSQQVDKAGATALFQEANMGSNNIGVVVNPVRLATLGEFGTPQFVADKLLQAERRKESTKDAEVITVAERSGKGGLQIYEFEYTLDSTRGGMKRIFSAAFVASKKLYLLNITHSDKPESPLEPHKRMILEQVLHSFDAAT